MAENTYSEIYEGFCKWNPEVGMMVTDYKPWGSTSILILLHNGMKFKVKRYGPNRFIMQSVSQDDINRKFGTS